VKPLDDSVNGCRYNIDIHSDSMLNDFQLARASFNVIQYQPEERAHSNDQLVERGRSRDFADDVDIFGGISRQK